MAPTPAEVTRVIQRMQKKDLYGIFREPVTDEMVRTTCMLLQACCTLDKDCHAVGSGNGSAAPETLLTLLH